MRFLFDANLSPKTAEFLRRRFSFESTSLIAENLGGLSDEEVVNKAQKEKSIIVTLDLDFGKLYHETKQPAPCGIIIIRTRDQRSIHINELLERFFLTGGGEKIFSDNPLGLVVIQDAEVRILDIRA